MKPPKSLTDGELIKYADDHISYEINMLAWTASFLIGMSRSNLSGPLATAVRNSFLDDFAIHARNLVDFFYKRDTGKDKKSDIVVQDYIDEAKLKGTLPAMTPALAVVNKKANKQVAHLTLERIDYEEQGKGWDFGQIAIDAMKAFNAIAHLFPPTKTSESFRQIVKKPAGQLILISARQDMSPATSMPTGLKLSIDLNPGNV